MLLFLFLFGLALGAVTPSDDPVLALGAVTPSDDPVLALGAVTPSDDPVLALGAVSPSDDRQLTLLKGNCPMFWYSFNNRCYKYVATRMTWADAELHCVSQRANLVSIHSQEEHNFVKTLIKNFDPAEGFTWIGLSDIHKEFAWMWSDGSAANFVFWASGQPDDANGVERCVHTSYPEELKWNDIPCSYTFHSVCASRN
ncbi:lactose-binding lectin l-2-like [Cebidichthys violaceus]|uniref:lactose-binding lectin l-2-like n=1 Tax=Cebidichthys violaceus TaxID=271503 RepID=UPI0035CB06BF